MNAAGVIDSLGSLMVFFFPSLIGGIYSAILVTTGAYGPTHSGENLQAYAHDRTRFGQGGYQLIGIALSVGIGLASGLLIGLFSKVFIGQKSQE